MQRCPHRFSFGEHQRCLLRSITSAASLRMTALASRRIGCQDSGLKAEGCWLCPRSTMGKVCTVMSQAVRAENESNNEFRITTSDEGQIMNCKVWCTSNCKQQPWLQNDRSDRRISWPGVLCAHSQQCLELLEGENNGKLCTAAVKMRSLTGELHAESCHSVLRGAQLACVILLASSFAIDLGHQRAYGAALHQHR